MDPGRPSPGSPIAPTRARRAPWLLLLAAVLLCPHAPASAQRDTRTLELERLRTWRMAMDLHSPGHADDPALEIARWPVDDLDQALATFNSLVRRRLQRRDLQRLLAEYRDSPAETRDIVDWLGLTPDEMVRGDGTRVLKRAALLHTDIALLVEGQSPPPRGLSPRQGRTSVLVHDGRFDSYDLSSEHWPFARRVLDHVHRVSTEDPTVRQWYRAVAAHLAGQFDYGELRLHLEHGRSRLPDDGVLAMMAGVRHQAMAAARVQASLAGLVAPPGSRILVGSRHEELASARAAYRDALKRDPTLVEARVRLGRVLADEGKPEEAVRELRSALEAADEPVLQYFAALFLGEQEGVLGRPDAARAAFDRAATLYPKAHAPRLGLSQLARASGDRDAALDALGYVVGPSVNPHPDDDPWWSFEASAGRRAEEWMTAVRRTLGGEATP